MVVALSSLNKRDLSHIVNTKLKRRGFLLKPRWGKNLEGVLAAGGNSMTLPRYPLAVDRNPQNSHRPCNKVLTHLGFSVPLQPYAAAPVPKVFPSLKMKGIP